MGEFDLQYRVVRQILKDKPGVRQGMERVVDELAAKPSGKGWRAACKGIDWDKGQARWVRWFDRLLKTHPLPRNSELLWFEVPSNLNPALTSVSAFAKIGSAEESYGLDARRRWPVDPKGNTLDEGLLPLPELEHALLAGGLNRDDESTEQDQLRPGVYALSYAYAILLTLNGLPNTNVLKSLASAGGVGVLVGWADGDFDRVGLLKASGWSTLKPRTSSRSAPPDYMDPDKYGCVNVRGYLKWGGDLEHRGKKHGETVLMKQHYDDTESIRLLLEAGADAKAVDNEGSNVLHWFMPCELSTLKLLLAAGADAKGRNKKGQTVLDTALSRGGCTIQHVELLDAAGARLSRGNNPLFELSQRDASDRAEFKESAKQLRFWLAGRYKLDARDEAGRTPLWVSLEAHASGLARHMKQLKKKSSGDATDGKHDEMAMLLLEHGADPDGRLKESKEPLIPRGATPLMVRRYDRDRLVRALLAKGANPKARCAEGKTALDYARAAAADTKRPDRAGAAKVVRLLEQALAGDPRPRREREVARRKARPVH